MAHQQLYCGQAFLLPKYKAVNPSNQAQLNGTYLSCVIANTDDQYKPDWFREYAKALADKLISENGKSNRWIALSLHEAADDSPWQHIHLGYYHYARCKASQTIWKSLCNYKGLHLSYQKVCCQHCAYKYIYQDSRKQPIRACRESTVPPCIGPHFVFDFEDSTRGTNEGGEDNRSHRSSTIQSQCGESSGLPNQPTKRGTDEPNNIRTKAQKITVQKMQWARDICHRYAVCDYIQFKKALAEAYKDGLIQSDFIDQHTANTTNPMYQKQIEAQIEWNQITYQNMTMEQALELFDPKVYEIKYREKLMPLQVSFYFMLYLIQLNKLEGLNHVETVFNIMNRENGKVNCAWYTGKSNAFKSKQTNSLVRGFPYCVNIPIISKDTIRFLWSFLVLAQVAIADEGEITDSIKESVKSFLGGDSTSSEVKGHGPVQVVPCPIAISSNGYPWTNIGHRNIAEYEQQMRNRCYIVECREVVAGNRFPGGIDPRVWIKLRAHYRGLWADTPDCRYDATEYGEFTQWINSGEGGHYREIFQQFERQKKSRELFEREQATANVECELGQREPTPMPDVIAEESDEEIFENSQPFECFRERIMQTQGTQGTQDSLEMLLRDNELPLPLEPLSFSQLFNFE